MADKKYTTVKEMFESGTILQAYGSKYLVSVCPAFAIDRVRVSVVTLNTRGMDSTDIYLTCEEMRKFCEEIDNGTAYKKILADTGNYPTAYKWVKGKDGSKSLTIGGGQKGIRVLTHDKKMTVVQYSDLRTMSFNYKLVSGLTPIGEGYYKNLFNAFEKSTENAEKYFKNYDSTANDAEEKVIEETENITPVPPVEPRVDNSQLAKQLLNRNNEERKDTEQKSPEKVRVEILEGKFYIKSPMEPVENNRGETNYEAFVQPQGSDKFEKMVFYYNQFPDKDLLRRLVAKAALNTENSKGILIYCRYSKSQSLIYRGMVTAKVA